MDCSSRKCHERDVSGCVDELTEDENVDGRQHDGDRGDCRSPAELGMAGDMPDQHTPKERVREAGSGVVDAEQQERQGDPDGLQQGPCLLGMGHRGVDLIELGDVVDHPPTTCDEVARDHGIVGIVGVPDERRSHHASDHCGSQHRPDHRNSQSSKRDQPLPKYSSVRPTTDHGQRAECSEPQQCRPPVHRVAGSL